MKNTIFKSYSKKIFKSGTFISIAVVFVLALGIIGTSYALFMDVDTDTDYQLINIGDLAVSFSDGKDTISIDNMLPTDNDIALKQTNNIFSFYLYNTGSYIANYDLKLVPFEGNEVDSKYINYQLCINDVSNCENINTLSNTNDFIIHTDELARKKTSDASNPSVYYFLRIWINNKFPKEEAGKSLKLKTVIDVRNASGNLNSTKTLAGNILNNSFITINEDNPKLFDNEENEVGLYKISDEVGVNYYFRGKSSYNYLDFAGMCFRIVKINGDGTIKIILEDKNNLCANTSLDYSINNSSYNISNIDDFENNLSQYIKNISNTNSCIDDKKYSDELGNNIIEDILNYNTYYYETYNRLITKRLENIKCSTNLGRYSSLLSADEYILAGGSNKLKNNEFYLKTNDDNYWLQSPAYYENGKNYQYAIIDGVITAVDVNTPLNYRPVLNLKAGVLYKQGNGSKENAYQVK